MDNHWSDAATLAELGSRIAARRLNRQWRQADLAYEAGVSKRTVERIEAGVSVQAVMLLRVLRALGLLGGLDQLVPPGGPSPMELLELQARRRKRGKRRGSTSVS